MRYRRRRASRTPVANCVSRTSIMCVLRSGHPGVFWGVILKVSRAGLLRDFTWGEDYVCVFCFFLFCARLPKNATDKRKRRSICSFLILILYLFCFAFFDARVFFLIYICIFFIVRFLKCAKNKTKQNTNSKHIFFFFVSSFSCFCFAVLCFAFLRLQVQSAKDQNPLALPWFTGKHVSPCSKCEDLWKVAWSAREDFLRDMLKAESGKDYQLVASSGDNLRCVCVSVAVPLAVAVSRVCVSVCLVYVFLCMCFCYFVFVILFLFLFLTFLWCSFYSLLVVILLCVCLCLSFMLLPVLSIFRLFFSCYPFLACFLCFFAFAPFPPTVFVLNFCSFFIPHFLVYFFLALFLRIDT